MLTHICSIENHPVRSLKQEDRIAYISALGHVMSTLWIGQTEPQVLYEAWTKCIDSNIDAISLYTRTDDKTLKKALSVGDNWWKFWETKRNYLIFDCFYLASYDSNTDTLQSAYSILKNYCNGKHEKILEQIFLLFKTNKAEETPGISDVQINAYKRNKTFHEKTPKKVLVVATMSAGKSMLINALTGRRVCKTANRACTSELKSIFNKPYDGISIGSKAGCYLIAESDNNAMDSNVLYTDYKSHLGNVELIDTPGVNYSADTSHGKVTYQAIEKNEYDVLLFISNCQYNCSTDENELLSHISTKCKRPILFVLNQLDRFNSKEDDVIKMMNSYSQELHDIGFKNTHVLLVSGYAAFLLKMGAQKLDEEEQFQLELFEKKFSRDYFNLPIYMNTQSNTLLDRTGITKLEIEINNI